jgi:hypothetical protein
LLNILKSIFILTLTVFIPDDQPFLPINPFAEPATTMSTTNSNHRPGDDDMIDIDFQNTTNDRSNSKFIHKQK